MLIRSHEPYLGGGEISKSTVYLNLIRLSPFHIKHPSHIVQTVFVLRKFWTMSTKEMIDCVVPKKSKKAIVECEQITQKMEYYALTTWLCQSKLYLFGCLFVLFLYEANKQEKEVTGTDLALIGGIFLERVNKIGLKWIESLQSICVLFTRFLAWTRLEKNETLVRQFYVWQNWFELLHFSLYGSAGSVHWTRTFLRGVANLVSMVNAIRRSFYAFVQHSHSSLNYQITNPVFLRTTLPI